MLYAGSEEKQLDERLTSLEAQAGKDVNTMSTLGSPETRPQAAELLARVKSCMGQMRACMRDLQQLGEEQDTEEMTAEIAGMVKHHKKQYEGLKRTLNDVYEQMKKNAEQAWQKQRKELLAGATEPSYQIQSQQEAVKTSQKTTESLRRTHEQMKQQIELSDGNLQVLGDSTQKLVKAREELLEQKEKYSTAGRLLNSLQRQDTWDRMALWGGVIIFSMAVLFIFQKRVLGLTPDIVKSSITSAVSTSVSTVYDLGKMAMEATASRKEHKEDPTAIPSTAFDDLMDELDELDDRIGAVHDEIPPTCSAGETLVDGTCKWIDGGLEVDALDQAPADAVDPGAGSKEGIPVMPDMNAVDQSAHEETVVMETNDIVEESHEESHGLPQDSEQSEEEDADSIEGVGTGDGGRATIQEGENHEGAPVHERENDELDSHVEDEPEEAVGEADSHLGDTTLDTNPIPETSSLQGNEGSGDDEYDDEEDQYQDSDGEFDEQVKDGTKGGSIPNPSEDEYDYDDSIEEEEEDFDDDHIVEAGAKVDSSPSSVDESDSGGPVINGDEQGKELDDNLSKEEEDKHEPAHDKDDSELDDYEEEDKEEDEYMDEDGEEEVYKDEL